MLEQQKQAPQPLLEESKEEEEPPLLDNSSDEEPLRNDEDAAVPPTAPTSGNNAEFVGHVETEEDMENHFIFYRPSQGKKVLVVDRERNECFFLKWKTFNKDQRKGRELDPRYFDQVEKQKFDASDAKEWQSFLDTGAVTVVPPD